MRKWMAILVIVAVAQAGGMFPLPQGIAAQRNDVGTQRIRRNRRRRGSVRVTKTTRTLYLSIEVQNMTASVMRNMEIPYHFYELRFGPLVGRGPASARKKGNKGRLVESKSGQFNIAVLKPHEKRVLVTRPFTVTYRSIQDKRKLITKTTTKGKKFGGYVVEYCVGGQLVKCDASSRRLHEAHFSSIRRPGSSSTLGRMLALRRRSLALRTNVTVKSSRDRGPGRGALRAPRDRRK